jgi:hypothetical protein
LQSARVDVGHTGAVPADREALCEQAAGAAQLGSKQIQLGLESFFYFLKIFKSLQVQTFVQN